MGDGVATRDCSALLPVLAEVPRPSGGLEERQPCRGPGLWAPAPSALAGGWDGVRSRFFAAEGLTLLPKTPSPESQAQTACSKKSVSLSVYSAPTGGLYSL